ncbi:hypothetical protein BDZ94DRAFT_1259638, partial [Collybia nuda]
VSLQAMLFAFCIFINKFPWNILNNPAKKRVILMPLGRRMNKRRHKHRAFTFTE